MTAIFGARSGLEPNQIGHVINGARAAQYLLELWAVLCHVGVEHSLRFRRVVDNGGGQFVVRVAYAQQPLGIIGEARTPARSRYGNGVDVLADANPPRCGEPAAANR